MNYQGQARVYIGPQPERGFGHEGFRGFIETDDRGVHFSEGEWLVGGTGGWDDIEGPESILPWHCVSLVEWL